MVRSNLLCLPLLLIMMLFACKREDTKSSFFSLPDSTSIATFDKTNNDYIKLITFSNGNNELILKSGDLIYKLTLKLQGNIAIEEWDNSTIFLKNCISTDTKNYQEWIENKDRTPDSIGKYKIKYKIEKINSSSLGQSIIVDSIYYNSEKFSLMLFNKNEYINTVEVKGIVFSKDGAQIHSVANGGYLVNQNIEFSSNLSLLDELKLRVEGK